MTYTEQIELIRAYAVTAKTAIYNEHAMTAIELAGVTACKVNECVKAINGILDLLESANPLTVDYDAESESVAI